MIWLTSISRVPMTWSTVLALLPSAVCTVPSGAYEKCIVQCTPISVSPEVGTLLYYMVKRTHGKSSVMYVSFRYNRGVSSTFVFCTHARTLHNLADFNL